MSLFGSKDKTKKAPAQPAAPTAVSASATAKKAASMQDLYSASAAAPKKAGVKASGAVVNDAYRILLSPLVTEKATTLHAANKYVFVIAAGANKISVARAVKSAYGVNPIKVNISNVGGKIVNRGRVRGQRNDWRKAVVTLKPGETIKIYEGV